MLANSVIIQGSWTDLQMQLMRVRTQVFIEEQCVPATIEWDDEDANAIHLLVLDAAQTPLACARILKKGKIGRMAVLKAWRGCGIGRALLVQAIAVCRDLNLAKIAISSQTHAIKFYQQAGFVITSDAYIDANIWHVDMALVL